jgi:hypothetical protein
VIESAAFNATFGALRAEHSAWYQEHVTRGAQQLAEHSKRLAELEASGGAEGEAEQAECEQFVKWCGNTQDVKNVGWESVVFFWFVLCCVVFFVVCVCVCECVCVWCV